MARPCGCEDYHLADCPLLTGEPQDAPEPDDDYTEYDFLRDDVDLEDSLG